MRGKRVAIITMGGSWGVALSDRLEEEGLVVPELSSTIQTRLRSLGMPPRASTRNPVDIGAAGVSAFSPEALVAMGRVILSSDEVDALVLHGFGRPGFIREETPLGRKFFLGLEKQVMRSYNELQKETGKPVILGCRLSQWESQAIHDLQSEGLRIHHRLDEIAQILYGMYDYWRKSSFSLF